MRELVGIDIKSDYIKIVQLKKSKDNIKLFRAAVVQTPTDAISNNFIVDFEKISFALSKVFREYGIRTNNVAISISDRTIMLQMGKYPQMPLEELREVIRGETEQYSHFSGKEILVDFSIVNEITEGNTQKVNLFWVACLNESVSCLRKALHSTLIIKSFNTAGFLRFLFCEPTCLAFLRSVRRNLIINQNIGAQVTVCIVINDTTTDMVALQGTDNVIFVRSLYTGRADFDKFLRIGEDLLLLNPIPQSLANLVVELQRSLSFLARQIPVEVNIKQIFVGGSIQYLNKIAELLTRELKINVEAHNPLEHISIDKEFFSSMFLEQFGVSLAPAIGLALRPEMDNKVNVNLIPAKEPATVALEQIKHLTLPAFIFATAIFLCINVWIAVNIAYVKGNYLMYDKDNKKLTKQIKKLEDIRKSRLMEAEKIKSLEEFKKTSSTGLDCPELLNNISKLAVNYVWLTKLEVSETKVITASGYGLSYVSISDFMSELNKSTYFRDFNLVESTNEASTDSVKFTIAGYLK